MRWIRKARLRLRSVARRRQVEQELDDELRYHIERQIDELVRRGMAIDDARAAALRDLGGIAHRKDECRDARGLVWLETLLQDARYALRGLRRNPGFTLVAIVSLALVIGANTTIFAFLNAVALRPLPYPSPERIVVLRERFTTGEGTVNVHPFNYLEWRAQSPASTPSSHSCQE